MKSILREDRMYQLRRSLFSIELFGIIILFLGILSFASNCESIEKQIIIGKTDAEILIEKGRASSLLALSEEEYDKIAEMLAKQTKFIVLRKKLETSKETMYGYNFPHGRDYRVGFSLMGNDQIGYNLCPDLDGNGDLNNDPVYEFDLKNDQYILEFDESIPSLEKSDTVPTRLKFLLVISSSKRPGVEGPQTNILLYNEFVRYGKLHVGDRDITFALRGKGEVYGMPHQDVFFDMNEDGEFDLSRIRSFEKYLVSEKYVNLGGWSYEFLVDPKGENLKLVPLQNKREPRIELIAGYMAPDFNFIDMNGISRSFSEYRDKIVLLEFWGYWCAPCWEAAPYLMKAYADYHDQGFDVLGIHSGDEKEKIQDFLKKFKMYWTQIIETDSNCPIHDLFRVDRWPTYFLIDRDGKIISDELHAEQLEEELKRIYSLNQ